MLIFLDALFFCLLWVDSLYPDGQWAIWDFYTLPSREGCQANGHSLRVNWHLSVFHSFINAFSFSTSLWRLLYNRHCDVCWEYKSNILLLTGFFQLACFQSSSICSMNQYFIPLSGWMIFHCIDKPYAVYSFIC